MAGSTAALICDTGALLDYLVERAPDHRLFRSAIGRARTRYVPALVLAELDYFLRNEGFFVADGQQCLETADRTHVMNRGDTLMLPAGIAMRLVATGPTPRRALAVIVYDASQPPTTRMEGEATPKLMSCK